VAEDVDPVSPVLVQVGFQPVPLLGLFAESGVEDEAVDYDEVDVGVVEAIICWPVVSVEVFYVLVVDYVGGDGGVVLVSNVVVTGDEVRGGF